MKSNKTLSYIVGIILVLVGIFLTIRKEPHFYTFFSIGALLILFQVNKSLSKEQLFHKWKAKNHLVFWIMLIVASIIIDLIGMHLGYWTYTYSTTFDEVLKYVFEWAIAMSYITLAFLIGFNLFRKLNFSKPISTILSMMIFVITIGLITEYLNHFSNSWIIMSMPITNYKIGNFFIVFQTIGYWLMVVITSIIYKISNKIK